MLWTMLWKIFYWFSANGSATPDDFFISLDKEVHRSHHTRSHNLADLMYTWLSKSSYPKLFAYKDGETRASIVSHDSKFKDDEQPRWPIPMTYVAEERINFAGELPITWLNNNSTNMRNNYIDIIHRIGKWIIFNIQQFGEYWSYVYLFFFLFLSSQEINVK